MEAPSFGACLVQLVEEIIVTFIVCLVPLSRVM